MKKYLLLLPLLLLIVVSGSLAPSVQAASYAVTQTAHNSGTTVSTITVTITSSGAGHLLVLNFFESSGSAPTISDSASDTWTLADSLSGGYLYYLVGCPAGITSVTATTGAGNDILMVVREYDCTPAVTALDVSAKSSGASNPQGSGNTAATSTTNELVVGAATATQPFASTPILAVGTGYGNFEEDLFTFGGVKTTSNSIEDKLVTSTGVQSAGFANANTYTVNVICAAFAMPVPATRRRASHSSVY